MRIFVSWSGSFSRSVAELLRDWIPNVIQEASVYVSSQDIAKGESWPENIRGNLSEIDLGVVVVTKSNFEAPWIMFEAGALSKSVRSKMIPLLCGVDQVDLAKSPLRLFQGCKGESRDDMSAMLQSLNASAATPLSAERLEVAFDKWWPDFAGAYQQLEQDPPAAKEGKKVDDQLLLSALGALLEDVQSIKSQLRNRPATVAPTLIPTGLGGASGLLWGGSGSTSESLPVSSLVDLLTRDPPPKAKGKGPKETN